MDIALWTDERLGELRTLGDPPADAAVAHLELKGSLAQVSDFLITLIQNDNSVLVERKDELPPAIVAFVEAHLALPPWADPAKIARGQDVFMRHGPAALAALLCASLPECYSHKNGAQVLWYTQNLEAHTVRRVYQTAKIILDVMQPGGLDVGGPGVLTATKTRLLHAAMRRLILSRPSPEPPKEAPTTLAEKAHRSTWNPAWGTPINQEDSVFTLLTFSYVILRAWDSMGVSLTKDERDAYMHSWNVVGYYLGVPEAYMLDTQDEAKAAFARLQQHQQAASDEGRDLTSSLRKVIMEIVPDEKLAEHIDHTLTRLLVGPQTAQVLGLPSPDLGDLVIVIGYEGQRIARDLLEVLRDIVVGLTGGTREGSAIEDFGVRVGAAITELLVALVGRGEKGFSLGEIGARAGDLLATAAEAKEPVTAQVKLVIGAESSGATRRDLASQLGIHLCKALTGVSPWPQTGSPRPYVLHPDHARAWNL